MIALIRYPALNFGLGDRGHGHPSDRFQMRGVRPHVAREVHIPPLLNHIVTSIAIALFRTIRFLKRALQPVFGGIVWALLLVARLLARLLVLPIYRLAVTVKIRFHKYALPTQSAALMLVTNKYLFHTALGLATLATLIVNLQARQAHAQDVGKNSLLYALATGSETSIVEETAAESPTHASPHIAPGTLIAIPHIDFDYESGDLEIASLSVPGAISALPTLDLENPMAPRTKTETYVVQEGDAIGTIARAFGVDVGTILWSNNLTERQYIRPGDALRIPPVSGVLVTLKKGDTISKLAVTYDADVEEILETNRITDETTLALGTEIVIPGGRPPAPVQTIASITQRGSEPTVRSGSIVSNTKKPADADTANLPSTRLLWPTSGHVITQYYGWRHTGLDIDGDLTSPLYAAYDGVVTTAGWNSGGYGLQILIQHPNGMTTRYAHASKLFVKVGDQVTRGEVIAMMGNTGRSTGSHLHFEVYVGSKRQNPLSYIR
ncbi:M23 family metallopeptidase [Patescibacteria group bacterium]|nr:M23 family metallopeptidase [Patescibacteria group bacterium]MBU2613328.1 M23 family metallopeptidase [Patescibacteria group bacterium]